MIEELLI